MDYKKQRTLLFLGLTIAVVMVIVQSGLLDVIFWFMLAGVVPGTDYVIMPAVMLLGYFVLGLAIISWAIKKELYPGSPSLKKAQQEANKQAAITYNRKLAAIKRKEAKESVAIANRRQRYTS
jgi:hypothetical protein